MTFDEKDAEISDLKKDSEINNLKKDKELLELKLYIAENKK